MSREKLTMDDPPLTHGPALGPELVSATDSRGLSFVEIADGWAAEVLRLRMESTRSPSQNNAFEAWGPDDLYASYNTRTRVEHLLALHEVEAPALVVSSDVLLWSFTEEAGFDWVSVLGLEHQPGWWWKRIPVAGPIRREIDRRRDR